MSGNLKQTEEAPAKRLEGRMQKVSLVVSLAGLGLMSFGLIDMLLHGDTFSLPGPAVVTLQCFISLQPEPLGLTLTSAGVLLLGLLPAIRVFLAAVLYVRSRNLSATLVAAVVLLELLLSIRLGS